VSKQHFYLVAGWAVSALILITSAGCTGPWERATPKVEAEAVSPGEVAPESQPVRVVSPPNGSLATQNQPVNITVEVRSPKGINRVELFYKNQLIGSDSPAGVTFYRGAFDWKPPEAGSLTVTVWAYDQDGGVLGPASVLLNVALDQELRQLQAPPTSTLPPPCTDNASLESISVPDGYRVTPGTAVNVTWRVRNSGNCQWDSSYKLAFVGGERMGGEESLAVSGVIGEQGTVEFTAHLYAPQTPKIYEGRWKMKDSSGTEFGNDVYVRIEVIPAATSTPTLTPTATPTPLVTPSVTPTPKITIHSFTADPTTIERGQSSILRWEVEGAKQIYLYPGGESGVSSVSSYVASPASTTTYRLVAVYDWTRDERQVTITVKEPPLPDLVIEDVGLSPANYIRFRVRNAGEGHVTKSFRVHVDKSGVGIWDYDITGLSAGQSLSFELDREPVQGKERVHVVADSLHVVEESQKNNNEVTVELVASHRVTVNFTQVTVHNDGTPEGRGQLAFRFRVNGQEARYPFSGYVSAGDGDTLPLSAQIAIPELRAEQSLDILVQGLLNTADSGEISLGQVQVTYQYADARWQAGAHDELSSGGNGSFTIYYTVSVE
jgi:hypothetical protein